MGLQNLRDKFAPIWWDNFKHIIDDNFSYVVSLLKEYPILTSPLKFGNVDGYSQFDVDGSIRQYGDATVFDDLDQGISAINLYSVPGKVDFDFDNLWAVMEESGSLSTPGDCVFCKYQIIHATKADSVFKLHIHWAQSSQVVRTIDGKYRVQDNGTGATTDWEPFTATTEFGGTGGNIFDTSEWDYVTDGYFMQITNLADIDLTGLGVSAIVQVIISRTDDTALSDIFLLSMDGHIEKDSQGSRQEYIK